MKAHRDLVVDCIQTPNEIFYSPNTDHHILVLHTPEFLTNALVVYVKKTEEDAFVISAHPISNKNLKRSKKKWMLVTE